MSHTYLLLTKPTALTAEQWQAVLDRLQRVLDRVPDAAQPSDRMHWRLSADGNSVVLQASFDPETIKLASIAAYNSSAVDGKYTPAQIRTALANRVRVLDEDGVRAYLAANRARWEAAEVALG